MSSAQSHSHQINTFKHPFKGCGEAKAEPQAFIDSNLKEYKNYMAYAFTAGQLVNYNRGTPDALMEGIAGKLLSGARLKFGEIMRMDSYLRQETIYRQNEIEENEFEKQENARDKQQLEWERAEIKRYRELAKAERIAAQRANKRKRQN